MAEETGLSLALPEGRFSRVGAHAVTFTQFFFFKFQDQLMLLLCVIRHNSLTGGQ